MKRPGNILISMLLSLMIVYLGGGTVIMQCMRNNTMTIGANSGCCGAGNECAGKHGCMKVTAVKLSPTVKAQQVKADLTPHFVLSPLLADCGFSHILQAITLPVVQHVVDIPHAPPRLYLAIIRVLII